MATSASGSTVNRMTREQAKSHLAMVRQTKTRVAAQSALLDGRRSEFDGPHRRAEWDKFCEAFSKTKFTPGREEAEQKELREWQLNVEVAAFDNLEIASYINALHTIKGLATANFVPGGVIPFIRKYREPGELVTLACLSAVFPIVAREASEREHKSRPAASGVRPWTPEARSAELARIFV